jgi:hypothetical protein
LKRLRVRHADGRADEGQSKPDAQDEFHDFLPQFLSRRNTERGRAAVL